jgi:hypothetical protein
MEEEPVRIFVHPELQRELVFWKERIEKTLDHKLAGGVTTASRLAAEILKKERLKDKSSIRVEFRKRANSQKCDTFML